MKNRTYTQEAINKIMFDMDKVYARELHPDPVCHFTFMELYSDDNTSWFECNHCGHTKDGFK